MAGNIIELSGLSVSVDSVCYTPDIETPEDRPFAFLYALTIHNQTRETIQICGRKWVVTAVNGQQMVVEGDGVVGKFPRLKPGTSFSYNSYHVVSGISKAEGAFLGITDTGIPVFVRIPEFKMTPPAQQTN